MAQVEQYGYLRHINGSYHGRSNTVRLYAVKRPYRVKIRTTYDAYYCACDYRYIPFVYGRKGTILSSSTLRKRTVNGSVLVDLGRGGGGRNQAKRETTYFVLPEVQKAQWSIKRNEDAHTSWIAEAHGVQGIQMVQVHRFSLDFILRSVYFLDSRNTSFLPWIKSIDHLIIVVATYNIQ